MNDFQPSMRTVFLVQVIEQGSTIYDRGGNAIMQTQKQRFDDATGTGVLNGPQTEPNPATPTG